MIERPDWTVDPPSSPNLPALVPADRSRAEGGEIARPDWSGIAQTANEARPASRAGEGDAHRFSAEDLALIQPKDYSGDVAAEDEEDDDIEFDPDEHDRKLIASGAFTREQLSELYNLPADQIGKPRVTRQSVDQEIAGLEKRMREDRRGWFQDEAAQARHRALLELREKLPSKPEPAKTGSARDDEGDAPGLPQELLDEWAEQGGVQHHLEIAHSTAQAALEPLEDEEREQLETSFDGLPPGAQTQIYRFLAVEGGAFPAVSPAALEQFAETQEGSELVQIWSRQAARNVGIVRGRMDLMLRSMGDADREAAVKWFESLPTSHAKAVLAALAKQG